jgi:hypothetical protein
VADQGPAALHVPHLDPIAALCGQVAADGVKGKALDPAVVLPVYAVVQLTPAICREGERGRSSCKNGTAAAAATATAAWGHSRGH